MANKKFEVGAKLKAAPAPTPLESAPKTKTSDPKALVATPEPAALEKAEKGKKAQASKKRSKEQQMPVKETIKELTQNQSKVPTEVPTTVLSGRKLNDAEGKGEKVKEAKGKKQVAVEPAATEVVVAETTPVSKKGTPEQTSEKVIEKAAKMKRLTLDIAKPLHKAIKAKAVEEGMPMVDMLRSLLEKHYAK
jgi:predicted DNA binding CopG/RHH family protein